MMQRHILCAWCRGCSGCASGCEAAVGWVGPENDVGAPYECVGAAGDVVIVRWRVNIQAGATCAAC